MSPDGVCSGADLESPLICGLYGCGRASRLLLRPKRTEHEVGYGRRVEIAERIQDSVSSVAEEHMAARGYVSRIGPFDGAPAKRIGRILDDLDEY